MVDDRTVDRGPENELYAEYRNIAGQPLENAISRLRPKVDLFFDKVLVNAPDASVRQNRLTLLNTLLAGVFRDGGLFGNCHSIHRSQA